MRTHIRWATVCVLVFAAALYLPHISSLRADLAEEQRSYRVLALLGEAFERVRGNFVEEIDDEVLVEAAIQGSS